LAGSNTDRTRPDAGHDVGGGFLENLWAARRSTLLAAIGGLFAALVYLLINAFLSPEVTTYRQAISLVVSGPIPGTYPNGTRFAASDLRGSAILKNVHTDFRMEQFGVSQTDLDAALSVLPYSPAQEQINLKYRSLLAQPGINISERQKFEEDYARATAANQSAGALVSLTFRDGQRVPSVIAKAVLGSIVDEWSSLHVQRLGVAAAADARDSASLIDEDAIARLDLPAAYFTLDKAQIELVERTAKLIATPGFADIMISKNGRRLNDVRREAAALGAMYIRQLLAPIVNTGIARDPVSSTRVLSSLIEEEKINLAGIQQAIRQIDEIIVQSDTVRSLGSPSQPGSTTAQLSDATVSRLVDLSIENADLPYRRILFDEKKALGEQALMLTGLIERRQAIVSAIEAARGSPIPDAEELVKVFSLNAGRIASTQNSLWAEMNQLSELTGGDDFSSGKQIYVELPLRDSVVKSGGLYDSGSWLRALLILASFIAGGLLLQLGRTALRPQA
jgi:hypothetical protein